MPQLKNPHAGMKIEDINNWLINIQVTPFAGILMFSHVCLFISPWTVAHQSPLSMGFPRQEYWSRLPFPLSGYPPNPGTEPMSPMPPVVADRFITTSAIWKAQPWKRLVPLPVHLWGDSL